MPPVFPLVPNFPKTLGATRTNPGQLEGKKEFVCKIVESS
jgi:hypothetical protein